MRVQTITALESAFRRITELLYNTSVPVELLETEVAPFLSESVTFTDPLQFGVGKKLYRLGMAGFHAMSRFNFEFYQVSVQMNPRGDGGRVLVDGIMQLKQLSWLYVFPLRTLLVYDFILPDPKQPGRFLITAHEEMWSVGDMINALPAVGIVYSRFFRPVFARGFVLASQVSVRLQQFRTR